MNKEPMNIEEAIEKAKQYIKLIKEKDYCDECNELNEILGKHWNGSRNVAIAIETILSVYEKEKERLTEYEKQLDLDYVDENYISKDKIKNFIKEHGGTHFIAKADFQEILEEE